MSVVSIWLFLIIPLLTNKYQIKVGYAAKVDYSYLVLSDAGFDHNWIMFLIYFFDWFKMCERYEEKWHIRNIWFQYNIIIIVKYTIEYDAASIVKNHKNYN